MEEEFARDLECPICYDYYKKPVILSCGHSFCAACIKQILTKDAQSAQVSLKCPECRDPSQWRCQEEVTLKPNITLSRLVEGFLAHKGVKRSSLDAVPKPGSPPAPPAQLPLVGTLPSRQAARPQATSPKPTIPTKQELAHQPATPQIVGLGTCRALYPFAGQRASDLKLAIGDEVTITHKNPNGWWTGSCRGVAGDFPHNYVIELSTETDKVLPRCVALYDYTARQPDELTITRGCVITICEKPGVWWKGKLDSRFGAFPSNYVKEIASSDT
eukprot:TRINITY_DN8186_c0_g1_i1.p1 TRINITY_DN8186_c0_g1~~TRINITY_DN8186_c0_g1_i1.p1  ORF type:complete len:273 (-),score=19.95 TRINITY_DN8186_c0_g1_i1:376-1194(-)